MKEDWLKDIHDKMTDYEAEEPRGLWNDICRARQQEEQSETAGRSKTVVWLWTRRVAAVVAMVAFVVSIGYFTKDGKEKPSTSLTAEKVKTANTEKEEQVANIPDKTGEEPCVPAGNTCFRMPKEKLLAKAAVPSAQTSAEAIADTVAADKSSSETKQQTLEETTDTHRHKQQRHDKSNRGTYQNNYIAHANIGNDKSGKLSCAVFMTGGASSAFNRKSIGDNFSVGAGPDDSDWEDSPLLGILLYNQGKEIKTDIKHRLPVRAGVSLAYKINERLSLESGVTYTNLTSDMREGSDSHYFTGEQTLHYVGVPLNMRYKIISWKSLELYASSGLLAEKCVSGNQKKEYILNNKVEKEETQDLNEKPFQWSVNASAGLQYNISPSIGLYAEPGVSYYFNDGTSIKTIYKDKPCNFNLNLGLRFTFGNK